MKIGITGGIGAGKTTVCKLFESLGIPVYYADERAKKLMISNKQLKKSIKELLGEEAYFANGRPNRKVMAAKVFGDETVLKRLNALVHPAVHEDFALFYNDNKLQVPYVLNEAALLVENGSYTRFDKLIVVTCPEEIRVERVVKRDGVSEDMVRQRLKNQLPESEKVKHAHFLIDNSGTKSLVRQVWSVHQSLVSGLK